MDIKPISDNPFEADQQMNQIAKEFFNMDHGQEVKDLLFYGLVSLLLNKGIITQDELTEEVSQATTAYKVLKSRADNVANAET